MSVVGLISVNIVYGSLFDYEALGSFLEIGQTGLHGTEDFETEPPQSVDLFSLPFCKFII